MTPMSYQDVQCLSLCHATFLAEVLSEVIDSFSVLHNNGSKFGENTGEAHGR